MNNRRIASILSVALALALTSPSAFAQDAAPTPPSSARELFHRGQTLYEESRFAEALEQFRASLAVLTSPNTLLYIARCERQLHRLARAFRLYDEATSAADRRRSIEARYEETYHSAFSERATLANEVAFVVIRPTSMSLMAPPFVTINGETIENASWGAPIALDPGEVALVVSAEGREARRSLVATPGTTETWTVDLGGASNTVNSDWPPIRIVALVAGSVGVAAALSGIVTGVVAQTSYDALIRVCMGTTCPPGHEGQIASGMVLVTATNLLLAGGITLALGGGLGTLLAPRTGTQPPRTQAGVAPVSGGWVFSVSHAF